MLKLATKIANKALSDKTTPFGVTYCDHIVNLTTRVVEDDCKNHLKTIAVLSELIQQSPDWNEHLLRFFFPDEVVDSVVALTPQSNQSYDRFIEQVCQNKWAAYVKKAALETKISYLKEDTQDHILLVDYTKAYHRVLDSLAHAG